MSFNNKRRSNDSRIFGNRNNKRQRNNQNSFRNNYNFNKQKDLKDKVAAAKQRLLSKQTPEEESDEDPLIVTKDETPLLSLHNTELHPLFADMMNNNCQTNTEVKKIDNPLLNVKIRGNINKEALNPYFDPLNITDHDSKRKRRGLQFNEKGKYVAIANHVREKEQEAKRKEELGLNHNESLNELAYKAEYPPKIEWWDENLFYRGKDYNDLNEKANNYKEILKLDKDLDDEEYPITHYIQHPVVINAPWERNQPVQESLFLTKEERKRIRKNRRTELNKDKHDRIKLGLDPPPPPKVKLNNVMNVLTNQAIQDPTAVLIKVKKDIEERRLNHLKMNEERRLTSEERKEKILAKNEKSIKEKGIFSAVFKIDKLINTQHLYKIDMNAKQLNLLGCCCFRNGDFSLIIAEGAANSINKYKHLLLERITWEENVIEKSGLENNEQEQADPITGNKCQLIWEGELIKPHFQRWSSHKFETDDMILDFLIKYNCQNYFRHLKSVDQ